MYRKQAVCKYGRIPKTCLSSDWGLQPDPTKLDSLVTVSYTHLDVYKRQLENDAATMPIVNNTVTAVPRLPVAANIGRSSSPLAGLSLIHI